MSTYLEIEALNRIYITHKIEIRFSRVKLLAEKIDYPEVELKLDGKIFHFFVEDEYEDVRFNYPILNLCLVLRELEFYHESTDYLIWCKDHYLEPNHEDVLAHYKNLGIVYREIEEIIGKIDSQISDWDFEMRSGASWELRKKSKC